MWTMTEASLQCLSPPWWLSNDQICVETSGSKDPGDTALLARKQTDKAKTGGKEGQEMGKRNG